MPINHLRSCAIVLAVLASSTHAETTSVLQGKAVYTAPDQPPIQDGSILIAGSRIKAVASRSEQSAPAMPMASECNGGVLVAGFQNSHVHYARR